MKRSALDPSRRLDLYIRVGRVATKTFSMLDSSGGDYSLIYEDFQVIIKQYPGHYKNVVLLEVGSGLTISGNELLIELTVTQTDVAAGEYYWELYKNDDGQTWLSGKVFFHEGEFDGVVNDPSTLQVNEDPVIQITLNI